MRQRKCGSSSAGPSHTHTEQKGQEWTELKRSTHTEAVNAAACSRPVRRCGCFSDSLLCSNQQLSLFLIQSPALDRRRSLSLSLSLGISSPFSRGGGIGFERSVYKQKTNNKKKCGILLSNRPNAKLKTSLRKFNLSARSSLCLRPLCTRTRRCGFIAETSSLRSCPQISTCSILKHFPESSY